MLVSVLSREFPGGPVVRALHFYCMGHGFEIWLWNSDPTCGQCGQRNNNIKTPQTTSSTLKKKSKSPGMFKYDQKEGGKHSNSLK